MEAKKMTPKQMAREAERLMYHTDNPWSHRDEIFKLLGEAYKGGSALAASLMARAYREEELTQPDYEEEKRWRHIAADMGDGFALFEVACEHYDDPSEEIKYLKKSADAGSPLGMTFYAKAIFYSNPYRAEELLKKASRKGELYANYLLCKLYRYGVSFLFERNYELAKKYAFKNKKAEYSFSIVQIGNIYDFGIGTKKNYKKARYWYEKSVHDKDAQGYIGRHYIYGLGGLKKDYKKGVELLLEGLTEKPQQPLFFYELSRCYRLGLGVEKDLNKAKEYFDEYMKLGGNTN